MSTWARSDRIALASALSAIVGAVAAVLVIPQVQTLINARVQSSSGNSRDSNGTSHGGVSKSNSQPHEAGVLSREYSVIKGTVRDALSGLPIAGARVAVPASTSGFAAVSDKYGRFRLDAYRFGPNISVTVSVTATGYEKLLHEVALINGPIMFNPELSSAVGDRFVNLAGVWESRHDLSNGAITHATLRLNEGARPDHLDGTLEILISLRSAMGSDASTPPRVTPACRILISASAVYADGRATLRYRGGKVEQLSLRVKCSADDAIAELSESAEIQWVSADQFTVADAKVFDVSGFKRIEPES